MQMDYEEYLERYETEEKEIKPRDVEEIKFLVRSLIEEVKKLRSESSESSREFLHRARSEYLRGSARGSWLSSRRIPFYREAVVGHSRILHKVGSTGGGHVPWFNVAPEMFRFYGEPGTVVFAPVEGGVRQIAEESLPAKSGETSAGGETKEGEFDLLKRKVAELTQEIRSYRLGSRAMGQGLIVQIFSVAVLGVWMVFGIELVNPIFASFIWVAGLFVMILGYLLDKAEPSE